MDHDHQGGTVTPAPTSGARDVAEAGVPAMPAADRVVEALRANAADDAAVVRHLARWLGVRDRDAEAFGAVLYAEDRAVPLTPGGLAEQIGLTTGATGTLLNRLEDSGLVRRSREHQDRRVVTLRVPPDVRDQALAFFRPLAERVDAMMTEHGDELLRTVVALLDELHRVTAEVLDNMRVPPLRR